MRLKILVAPVLFCLNIHTMHTFRGITYADLCLPFKKRFYTVGCILSRQLDNKLESREFTLHCWLVGWLVGMCALCFSLNLTRMPFCWQHFLENRYMNLQLRHMENMLNVVHGCEFLAWHGEKCLKSLYEKERKRTAWNARSQSVW